VASRGNGHLFNRRSSPYKFHSALSAYSMAILSFVTTAILAIPALAQESDVSNPSFGRKTACTTLKLRYPSNTFWPNTTGYTYETQTREY
jgi:hypothetical protein